MSYKFDTIVNRTEAEALKEMIFKRVRQQAASMSDDIQNDIMGMARDSFETKNNPFAQMINEEVTNTVESTSPVELKTEEGIGFPQKELNPQVRNQQTLVIDKITSDALQNNMVEARVGLSNKKSFMGALNFLNSQAAVSLMKTRADRFEMVM